MGIQADEYCYWEQYDSAREDEAMQWRAREQVQAFVDEFYPFATGWRRGELIDAGEDALNGVEDWGLVWPDCESPCVHQVLSRDAWSMLKRVLASKWREQCDWRRSQRPTALAEPAPRIAVRSCPRPRAYRTRRRRATSRAGPNDESGEPEPPGLTPGGDHPTVTFVGKALQRRTVSQRSRASTPVFRRAGR